jgi:hypothetical protein
VKSYGRGRRAQHTRQPTANEHLQASAERSPGRRGWSRPTLFDDRRSDCHRRPRPEQTAPLTPPPQRASNSARYAASPPGSDVVQAAARTASAAVTAAPGTPAGSRHGRLGAAAARARWPAGPRRRRRPRRAGRAGGERGDRRRPGPRARLVVGRGESIHCPPKIQAASKAPTSFRLSGAGPGRVLSGTQCPHLIRFRAGREATQPSPAGDPGPGELV